MPRHRALDALALVAASLIGLLVTPTNAKAAEPVGAGAFVVAEGNGRWGYDGLIHVETAER